MSFEPRDYLRHILAEADYYELVWDVVKNRIPDLRRQIRSILEA